MRLVRRCIAIPALLALALATGALGAERATVAVHTGGVDFSPAVDYAYATLTVSGNGIIFSRVIDGGGRLSVGTYDPENRPLPDGAYKWRLELVPNERTARALRAAALEGGGGAPEAWTAQTGSFTISDGLVVDPELAEPSPDRPDPAVGTALLPAMRASMDPSRGLANDSDSAVGTRPDAERLVARAAARTPQPGSLAGLQQADRVNAERSDATASALGSSPEAALPTTNPEQPARASNSVGPRSNDGTNGRPRSQ